MFSEDSYSSIEPLSDGVLRTEDGATFNIHRILLVQRSDYFRALFVGLGGTKSDTLIPGIGQSTLRQILSYIYTGRVQLEEGNLRDILVAADYLLLDCLLQEGRRFAAEEMNVRNCVPLFLAACDIQRLELREDTHRFVQTHFVQVVRECGETIGDLQLSSLKELLDDKNLMVSGEKTVWLAIVLWVKRDVVERQKFVPSLVLCLALQDTDEKLAVEIFEHEFMQKNPHCRYHDAIKRAANDSSLDCLTHFAEHSAEPNRLLISTRLQKNIFLIMHRNDFGMNMYLSYDEKIDFWYQVQQFGVRYNYVFNIGHFVYMLDNSSHHNNFAFDLINRGDFFMAEMNVPRTFYCVVRVGNFIYALGGRMDDEWNTCVEYYEHNTDRWLWVRDMRLMYSCRAAVLGGKIYAVGKDPDDDVLMLQVYDPISDLWSILRAPTTRHDNFTLVVFCERLYIVGGAHRQSRGTKVEVYDAAEDTWRSHADMPFRYENPKAVVIRDVLLVCSGRRYADTSPAIYLQSRDTEAWKILDPSSPWNKIDEYEFLIVEDSEVIRALVNKRRVRGLIPERSPFPLASIKFMSLG